MGRTHTRRTHTGLVNWGIGGLNQGAGQGQGGGWSGGDVSFWGEMEGKMMICGKVCGNHPTTLTASWWAGYSGREGGAGRGEQRAEPRCRLEGLLKVYSSGSDPSFGSEPFPICNFYKYYL